MALQPDSRAGVPLHEIWAACTAACRDVARLPPRGFSPREVGTIRFYENQHARLYFATREEFRDLLAERFCDIEVETPRYELGERCPVFAARGR